MKICMYSVDEVFKLSTGGVKRFAELMDALITRGHDVTLYSADSTSVIKKNGLKGDCICSNGSKKDILRISTLIKKGAFERVIIFDVKAAAPLILCGIKNVYLFLRQDFYLYRKIMLEDKQTNAFYKTLFLILVCISEHMCFKKAKKIVIQCKFDLNGIMERHPLLRKEILSKSVLQINNINPTWVVESLTDVQSFEDSIDDKKYDLVFVGNFKDSRKGHNLLIPALQQLYDEGYSIKTAIIGDGKQLQYYKDECTKYPNIKFWGRLANPIPVIRDTKLMIVPSYVDSCPNTVMEALYNNIPVIGANRSGLPEILNCSDWLFEMDVQSIKNALKMWLVPDKIIQLKKNQSVRRKELIFDWGDKMAEIIEG